MSDGGKGSSSLKPHRKTFAEYLVRKNWSVRSLPVWLSQKQYESIVKGLIDTRSNASLSEVSRENLIDFRRKDVLVTLISIRVASNSTSSMKCSKISKVESLFIK